MHARCGCRRLDDGSRAVAMNGSQLLKGTLRQGHCDGTTFLVELGRTPRADYFVVHGASVYKFTLQRQLRILSYVQAKITP